MNFLIDVWKSSNEVILSLYNFLKVEGGERLCLPLSFFVAWVKPLCGKYPENMPYHCVAYSFGRQNGRLVTTFGSILRHILGFSAYFMFGIGFAHILSVERF